MKWMAALPMYNVTRELDALWRSLLGDVEKYMATCGKPTHVVQTADQVDDLPELWTRPDLLLSQTCGYPLLFVLPASIQVVCTPIFDVNGCDGPRYSSTIVVSASAYASGVTSLEACRGLRAAYNDDHSNSGMNAFRHAVAPYSRDGRFFGSVIRTGSHLASLRTVAAGEADVTAVDCVTFAFAEDALPDLTGAVRSIGSTTSSPGLPLIASATVDPARLDHLRNALDFALTFDPSRARLLKLSGFARLGRRDYDEITEMEESAVAKGYEALK